MARLAQSSGQALVLATLLSYSIQSAVPAAALAATPPPIPNKAPSAPPSLLKEAPPDPFLCHRQFVYQGKTLDCDTNVQRDGENLRPVIKDVPAAVSELNIYQNNRRTLRTTAYIASAGIAVAVGTFLGLRLAGQEWRPQGQALHPLSYLALGGLTVSAGSFIYGFAFYRVNEGHLQGAVQEFNRARPQTPIELQFKTGIAF